MGLILPDHVVAIIEIVEAAIALDNSGRDAQRPQHQRQAARVPFTVPFLDIEQEIRQRVQAHLAALQVQAVAEIARKGQIARQGLGYLGMSRRWYSGFFRQ